MWSGSIVGTPASSMSLMKMAMRARLMDMVRWRPVSSAVPFLTRYFFSCLRMVRALMGLSGLSLSATTTLLASW